MTKKNSRMFCDACQSEMHEGLSAWHFVCPACKFERSTLEQKINKVHSIDEIARENALRSIREHNFNLLLGWLKETSKSNGKPTLLDVGSAHGWFLQKAQENFDAQGIEPDQAMADYAIKKGLNVRKGFFPEVLDNSEKFDFIIFNDVLEHIPAVKNIIKSCSDHLKEDGILVINAPDRRGVFYKVSKFLKKLGMAGSFERMWQVGLPSPHLYYFDKNSISKIAAQAGFKIIKEHSLDSIAVKGLFDRINYAGGNKLINYLIGIAVLIFSPALKITPSDINVWFFKKN
jgi:SAM-dependent methyltransferase